MKVQSSKIALYLGNSHNEFVYPEIVFHVFFFMDVKLLMCVISTGILFSKLVGTNFKNLIIFLNYLKRKLNV